MLCAWRPDQTWLPADVDVLVAVGLVVPVVVEVVFPFRGVPAAGGVTLALKAPVVVTGRSRPDPPRLAGKFSLLRQGPPATLAAPMVKVGAGLLGAWAESP